MRGKKIVMHLDLTEFDTILAALRFWQKANGQCRNGAVVIDCEEYQAIAEIASEHGEPLTPTDIDALCERINFSQHDRPISESREMDLLILAEAAFMRGYTESQVVALIEAEEGVTSEDQAIGIVNKAK
jgi:hypothetical protein